MNVPEKIVARVTTPAGEGVPGIIVEMKVRAGHKNPYHIRFHATNDAGEAELTRGDFVGQFTDHWEEGLMDYDGSPETAAPVVEVSLFDPTWSITNRKLALAWPLFAHERTKWRTRDEEYAQRIACRNLDFVSEVQEINLEEESAIHMVVHPRREPAGRELVP